MDDLKILATRPSLFDSCIFASDEVTLAPAEALKPGERYYIGPEGIKILPAD